MGDNSFTNDNECDNYNEELCCTMNYRDRLISIDDDHSESSTSVSSTESSAHHINSEEFKMENKENNSIHSMCSDKQQCPLSYSSSLFDYGTPLQEGNSFRGTDDFGGRMINSKISRDFQKSTKTDLPFQKREHVSWDTTENVLQETSNIGTRQRNEYTKVMTNDAENSYLRNKENDPRNSMETVDDLLESPWDDLKSNENSSHNFPFCTTSFLLSTFARPKTYITKTVKDKLLSYTSKRPPSIKAKTINRDNSNKQNLTMSMSFPDNSFFLGCPKSSNTEAKKSSHRIGRCKSFTNIRKRLNDDGSSEDEVDEDIDINGIVKSYTMLDDSEEVLLEDYLFHDDELKSGNNYHHVNRLQNVDESKHLSQNRGKGSISGKLAYDNTSKKFWKRTDNEFVERSIDRRPSLVKLSSSSCSSDERVNDELSERFCSLDDPISHLELDGYTEEEINDARDFLCALNEIQNCIT